MRDLLTVPGAAPFNQLYLQLFGQRLARNVLHQGTKPMSPRHFSRALALLLLTLFLSACAVHAEQTHFEVAITPGDAAQFQPGRLKIPRGATVVWQNKDTNLHTVTCDPVLAQQQGAYSELPNGAQAWDSGDLATGDTWSYTFTTPGQYTYYSRRDFPNRMMGTIIVSP
jgi:plastocyanin